MDDNKLKEELESIAFKDCIDLKNTAKNQFVFLTKDKEYSFSLSAIEYVLS